MREFVPLMMKKNKSIFQFRHTVLGFSLLCAFTSASALSIDRAAGNIVLGRPLDLTVTVKLSPEDELSGLCATADVSYGEQTIDAGRITVSAEPGASASSQNVRIRSSYPVDEPIVVLQVKAGCKQTVSRRFVLLSDLSADIDRPAVVPVAKANPSIIINPQTESMLTMGSVKLDTPSSPVPQAVSQTPKSVSSVVRIKPKSSFLGGNGSQLSTQRPRLKLTPLDLSQDSDPVLQVTIEMLTMPVEDLNKRREAAALWRYLNLSPKEILRVNAQEDELNQIKLMMAKSQQQMQELNQQLQSAEEQRYANPLVYTLASFILLVLGGAAYLYHRMGGRGIPTAQWWKTVNAGNDFRPSEFSGDEGDADTESKPVVPVSNTAESTQKPIDVNKTVLVEGKKKTKIPVQAENAAQALPDTQDNKQPEVPDELDFELDVDINVPPAPESAAVQHKDFEHSLSGSMRSINTHDMLDIRQQAEFFMTLGQYEDAIDMLQNSIQQSDAANPLVYLDLLKILHTLSRKTEFDSIRKDFNRIFSGRVPPYIAFNEPSKGLETYQDVCEILTTHWPHQSAVHYIERCLVRGSPDVASGRVELEAFRDLLMLHDIAKQLDDSADANINEFSTAKSGFAIMNDFSDSEPIMLDMPELEPEAPVAVSLAPDLLLPPTFENQPTAEIDLDLSEPKDNLIDFDPSIFSLDLPETKQQ